MIVQLVIFKYDPMNSRSKKLIPNLKTDDTVAIFENFKYPWYNMKSVTKC